MLIFFSSYLPNILGMIGGDGAIIEDSLSAGIVVVDALSYLLDGLILGLLMKRYDVPNPDTPVSTTKKQLLVACAINGFLFAVLNCITDLIFGAINDSWRLCSILKVSPECEASFYIVFTVFMFVAGLLLPLWNRYCLPADAYPSDTILFALKTAVIVWLPNVLIMAFFGTPVLLTLLYGTAYTIMLILCALVYRNLPDPFGLLKTHKLRMGIPIIYTDLCLRIHFLHLKRCLSGHGLISFCTMHEEYPAVWIIGFVIESTEHTAQDIPNGCILDMVCDLQKIIDIPFRKEISPAAGQRLRISGL